MLIDSVHYIPVGCIHVPKPEVDYNFELITDGDRGSWLNAKLNDGSAAIDASFEVDANIEYLPADAQNALLKFSQLASLRRLLRARWALLQLHTNPTNADVLIVRVYLLPDDVQRRALDRSDSILRKARLVVLKQIEFSQEAWKGLQTPHSPGSPRVFNPESNESDESISLLHLFNSIPSPSPDQNLVQEPYTQDAMYDIMQGQVQGLTTEPYSYQRRSAALMLQKEAQPNYVLDPRLLHLKDINDSPWYMDPVTGTVLLEPRYYDGVPGGILAEEMGSGKTLICLSLILATRDLPTSPPDIHRAGNPPVRKSVASLAEMAASCAARHALPWKPYFRAYKAQQGYEFDNCVDALNRNIGYYHIPNLEPRRGYRNQTSSPTPTSKTILLSSTTIVIVPNNLVTQWKQEISKHTTGLNVLVLAKKETIPAQEDLIKYDIVLFAQSRFESLVKYGGIPSSSLSTVHFKRCIVDEGHKLGNSKISNRSNLLLGLDMLHMSYRWIVTGTPSHGLFGVDRSSLVNQALPINGEITTGQTTTEDRSTSMMEKKDLERIGSIATLYLKARPWANTTVEAGDTLADWGTYLLLPKHGSRSQGRWECLKSTLSSLIIRHQLSEIGNLLPMVDEKVVVLEGSYQDKLASNLFSMMIVFNSVQSQRTDADYFFHQKQKKALLQIVHNLKQASFFGGSFFSPSEIAKSVETAREFLLAKKVPISLEDEMILGEAISFGQLAMKNQLKGIGNQVHEMAVRVTGFPGDAGAAWALDSESNGDDDAICTSTSMLLALQKLVYNSADRQASLNLLLNGGLVGEGRRERERLHFNIAPRNDVPSANQQRSNTLAGNTKSGDDFVKKSRSHGVNDATPKKAIDPKLLSGPFESTLITATVSAKLSYLIDSLIKYQDKEKVIVFYENENIAWYLASMLDVLQIQHLIYAQGLTTERKAQYVHTFHHNSNFRILLMDLSQAAFGLDMREASRIYFINPVLNPQVEAQAIGRVRRISQKKPVSVETLVLKDSIDEVILERKKHMTQNEHRQVRSILDVRPIYNWIKNTKVSPMVAGDGDHMGQMARLQTPQPVFGRGFGRGQDPDDGIILSENHSAASTIALGPVNSLPSDETNTLKRSYASGPGRESGGENQNKGAVQVDERRTQRVRFTED